MGGDKNRLIGSLKNGWNLILEGMLEQHQESQILNENYQSLQHSLEDLNKSLQELSHLRHHLNRRLEHIKNEIEGLQLRSSTLKGTEREFTEQSILALEDEGHALQMELDLLEKRLRCLRSSEEPAVKPENL